MSIDGHTWSCPLLEPTRNNRSCSYFTAVFTSNSLLQKSCIFKRGAQDCCTLVLLYLSLSRPGVIRIRFVSGSKGWSVCVYHSAFTWQALDVHGASQHLRHLQKNLLFLSPGYTVNSQVAQYCLENNPLRDFTSLAGSLKLLINTVFTYGYLQILPLKSH